MCKIDTVCLLYAAKCNLIIEGKFNCIIVDSATNREMSVDHTRRTSLYETSVVDKLLLMLFISVLLLASTPCVLSQSMNSRCIERFYPCLCTLFKQKSIKETYISGR